MNEFKKILAPTDLSEDSSLGLRYAFSMAEKCSADLIIVHVASDQEAWQAVSDEMGFLSANVYTWTVDRIVSEAALDLNRFFEKHLNEFHTHSKIKKRVVLGQVVEKIVDVAREEDVDLIVMAPRIHGILKRLILGSVTEKVTRKAPCPVLSVYEPQRRRPWRGKRIPPVRGVLRGSEA